MTQQTNVKCPVCQAQVQAADINKHLDTVCCTTGKKAEGTASSSSHCPAKETSAAPKSPQQLLRPTITRDSYSCSKRQRTSTSKSPVAASDSIQVGDGQEDG